MSQTYPTLRRPEPRQAFTLIEFLVVISIIALLIAILLPALTRARQAAQQAACMSNQRQIGIASAVYHGEFQDMMVPIGWTGSNPHHTWRALFAKYLNGKSMNAQRCPAKADPAASVPVDSRGVSPHSYGINQVVGLHYMGDGVPKSTSNRRMDEVRTPSMTVFVGDLGFPANPLDLPEKWQGDRGVASWRYMRMPSDPLYRNTTHPWNLYPRHLETANVLFYDGHVESRGVTADLAKNLPGTGNCIYDSL